MSKKNKMNCKAHFYLLNEHFSIEHAEANNNGEESELNLKYEWQDELEVTSDVIDCSVEQGGTYTIQGQFEDGEAFSFDINSMRVFNLKDSNGGITQLACSESIIDSYELYTLEDCYELNVFIKDYEPLSNPIPGVYIAAQDFPKELILE